MIFFVLAGGLFGHPAISCICPWCNWVRFIFLSRLFLHLHNEKVRMKINEKVNLCCVRSGVNQVTSVNDRRHTHASAVKWWILITGHRCDPWVSWVIWAVVAVTVAHSWSEQEVHWEHTWGKITSVFRNVFKVYAVNRFYDIPDTITTWKE